MKKTLSVLAVLGIVSVMGAQSAHAFDWSSFNPAYWGHCPKCERKKKDCDCKRKCDPCKTEKKCNPCEKTITPCPTGAAAPCDPCKREVTQPQPCDPCNKLQNMAR